LKGTGGRPQLDASLENVPGACSVAAMRGWWLTLLAIAALLCACWGYRQSDWLIESLPRHMTQGIAQSDRLVPLYADPKPVDLTDELVRDRLIVAAAVMFGVTVLFRRLSLARVTLRAVPAVLCLMTVGLVAVNASVARVRGDRALTEPFNRPGLEYFHDTRRVRDDPLAFVERYHQLGPRLSHHAGTHPPGPVLFLWAIARVGGPSIETAAWAAIVAGAMVVFPAYALARTAMPRSRSLRLVGLLAAVPSIVLFGATSMDAVFLTLTTAALALGVRALKRPGFTSVALAGAGLWVACFFTFASVIVPIFLIWLSIVSRSRSRMLATLAIGAVFVGCQIVARWAIGYDMPAVVEQAVTRDLHGLGVTGFESAQMWIGLGLANVLAFLLGSGIALSGAYLAGATQRGSRSLQRWWNALALTTLTLGFSTLFTLETERVWLPMAVAMALVVVGLKRDGWWVVVLLAGQTLVSEAMLRVWW
jgi:hypothetical protein